MRVVRNLSITTRIVFVILLAILFLASSLYIISSHVLTKSYSDIENQAILKDLDRAYDAIANLSPQLTVKLRDWASWDESYQFVIDLNQEYLDSNVGPSNLANLEINAMIFTNAEGHIVFKRFISSETAEEIDSTEIGQYLEAHKELVTHSNPESLTTGILPSPNGPFMFSSLPILTSEGEGPINGSLTFGTFINKAVIDEVAALTHLSVEVFPHGDVSSPIDVTIAEKSLAAKSDYFINPLSETSIAAYRVINDYHGKPLLTLRVVTPREVYIQGKFTRSFFIVSVSVLFFVFGLILIELLQRIVVSRFITLGKTVQSIGEKNDLTIRIKEDAKDEIGALASSINGMLDKILAAKKAEEVSNEKVRAISRELKERLDETKQMNKMMIDREVKMVELKKELAILKGEEDV